MELTDMSNKKIHKAGERYVHRRSLCGLTPIRPEYWLDDWKLVTCARCLKLRKEIKNADNS